MSSMESTRASDGDLVAATWIFEKVALRDGLHVDRSKVRRAVDEAAETYFGIQEGGWWRWIVETGNSLGRNCRVLDAEVPQLVRLALDGVAVILRSEDGQTWQSLMATGRQLNVSTPGDDRPVRIVKPRQIAKLLRKAGFEGTLRCVVVESAETLSQSLVADAGEKKPQQRLLALLRAESSDIWVIVIFALVSGLLTMTTPLAVEALVNTVAFGRFLQPVIVLSLMLLTFLIFQAALKAVQTIVEKSFSGDCSRESQQNCPFDFHARASRRLMTSTHRNLSIAFLTLRQSRRSVRSCCWTGLHSC